MSEKTGTLVPALNRAIEGKNSPSFAIANGTRAFDKIEPFNAPKAEITNAIEISFPPYSPRKVCAALAAAGKASRYLVEFAVTTSPNGSA